MSLRSSCVVWLVCLALVAPCFAQSRIETNSRLRQARIFLENSQPQEALEAISEGLLLVPIYKLQGTEVEGNLYLAEALAHSALGDDAKAQGSFAKSIAVLEQLRPEYEDRYRDALRSLGDHHRNFGRPTQAIPLYLRWLELEPPPNEPERSATANLLHSLAAAYRDSGELEKAYRIFSEALARKKRLPTQDLASQAVTLSDLGEVCRLLGKYDLAEVYLERALTIRKARRQTAPTNYARVLNNLSLLKQATGARREALGLMEESYAIFSQVYQPGHEEMGVTLLNLADAQTNLGQLEQAERHYGQALEIMRVHHGPNSLEVAMVLHNLGVLLLEMNDLEKAQPYLEQALSLRRERLSPTHQLLIPNLINLASLHRKAGRDEQALTLYEQALSVGQAAFGPEHPDLAFTFDLMAGIPSLERDSPQVLEWTERAYQLRKKAFGSRAALTGQSLYSLGLLSQQRGELKKARGQLEEARSIFFESLGPQHLYSGQAVYHLGLVALEEGNQRRARAYAQEHSESIRDITREIFSFASERQRLAHAARLRPYDLMANLADAEGVARAVLRFKGAVLDSMMEDLSLARQSEDPILADQVEELFRLKEQLAHLQADPAAATSSGALKAADGARESARLRAELEKLETALARGRTGAAEVRRAFQVTPEQVVKALPPGAALVEIVRYGQLQERGLLEESYGAVVLAPGAEPSWTYLGSAEQIDGLVRRYKRFVRGIRGESSEEILAELYAALWSGLEKSLPSNTSTVLISPDAEVSFLSFATLRDPEHKFLGERFDLLYVSSGRDLVRQTVRVEQRRDAVLFGDPEFRQPYIDPLPFTREECQGLATLLGATPGWSVAQYLGEQASEARVKAVEQPTLLHIATHGYFEARSGDSDPMASSGLILSAGPEESGEDGYLTAGEVSLLDLAGTSLVTLSACDTGLGLAQAGEGVLGLRRGFVKAGARNLVMSLWPVPDKETAKFMQDFIARAQEVPPAVALAQVQRDWLIRLSQERSVTDAVRQVGAFVLNLQGRWTQS